MLGEALLNYYNLLLNIGPQPDGSVHPEDFETLSKLTQWIHALFSVFFNSFRASYSCNPAFYCKWTILFRVKCYFYPDFE